MDVNRIEEYLKGRFADYLLLYQSMVKINSFTENAPGVNELGRLTAKVFSQLGFSVETIQSLHPQFGRHVFLSTQGTSDTEIVLISHLDTVFPPQEEKQHDFAWRIEGDRVFGPGTEDIKGGTLIIYMMLSALKENQSDLFRKISWRVMINAAEERTDGEFRQLCLPRVRPNCLAALIFEADRDTPDSWQVVVQRKGLARFNLVVTGRDAHSGSDHENGINAITQAAHLVLKLDSLTDYQRELTANVGVISGGTVRNRVPQLATVEAEIRAFSQKVLDRAMKKVLELQHDKTVFSAHTKHTCDIEAVLKELLPTWDRNSKSDQLFSLWQQAGESLGMKVAASKRGGGSDGNLIWQDIPTVDGLGPKGGNAHCSVQDPEKGKEQEYARISSFIPRTLLNLKALEQLLKS